MAQLSTLDLSLYANRKFNPSEGDPLEIIYEVTNHIPGMPFGVAFADIVESARHMHEHTHEIYIHVEGPALRVELGDGPSRIAVTTIPAFSKADYILLETPPE
jgi:hypothetical protein